MTAAHEPALVAAAQAAVAAGMAAANEYHAAAATYPGVGMAIPLPVPASGAATGLNFADGPAAPRGADPAVGGLTYVGPGGQLDGTRAYRSSAESLVYIPVSASSPSSTSRPSLGSRVRSALRALWSR